MSNKAFQIIPSEISQQEKPFKLKSSTLNQVNMKVKVLKDHYQESLIGGQDTAIAFKNETSYLIGTSDGALKLIENNKIVYFDYLPGNQKFVRMIDEIFYAEHLDCYFFTMPYRLYRMEIGDKPPVLFIDYDVKALEMIQNFEYSRKNKRLIFSNSKIGVLNLSTKITEIEVERRYGDFCDFKLFGKHRLIGITYDSGESAYFLSLYRLSCSRGLLALMNESRIEKLQDRNEIFDSLEVCDRNQYCLVELSGMNGRARYCSRMLIFEVSKGKLKLKVNFDVLTQKMARKRSLKCGGYSGKYLFWIGLSNKGMAHLCAFDTKRNELKELVDKSVAQPESEPSRIHKFGESLYYTGDWAKVVKLSIEY